VSIPTPSKSLSNEYPRKIAFFGSDGDAKRTTRVATTLINRKKTNAGSFL
jgi:hypothetical protein